MNKLLFIPLFFLVVILGCKEDAITEPTKYEVTISGKVIDEAELPIGFCDVTVLYDGETKKNK